MLAMDISNNWQRTLLALDHFVQLTQVTNPADAVIIFWKNEQGACPFTFLVGHKYNKVNKMVKFTFECGQMNAGHEIWPRDYCFGMWNDQCVPCQ